jgi:hypothetical protein
MWTPRPRWMPAQLRQMNVPNFGEAYNNTQGTLSACSAKIGSWSSQPSIGTHECM